MLEKELPRALAPIIPTRIIEKTNRKGISLKTDYSRSVFDSIFNKSNNHKNVHTLAFLSKLSINKIIHLFFSPTDFGLLPLT